MSSKIWIADSGASSTVSWRLSPSSSGYKSQSQVSESVTPSPTSTPNLSLVDSSGRHESVATAYSDCIDKEKLDSHLVWAVSDINTVPRGSIIIDPQTGHAVKNIDGSLYHYDPQNPPPAAMSRQPHKPLSPAKRRSNFNRSSRSSVATTATSPSLPFTPPIQQQDQGCGPQQFSPVPESMGGVGMPQFQPSYGPAVMQPEASMPVYQPPYVVYASYGLPHYDTRMVRKCRYPDL